LEAGYENFKIGALIQEARVEKGLTQEQLAEKVGTTKSIKKRKILLQPPFTT
jgi:ribosome-binding protein aMBF1 (putative translation factor)